MTIEDKVREIALAPISKGDFEKYSDPNDYFYSLCVKAYNLGIQIASENASTKCEHNFFGEEYIIDTQSILKWKITT